MATPAKPDPDKLKLYARTVFGALSGAMTSALIHLGERLGLYRMLGERGPMTSDELAAAAGLSERWVREWLYQQAAANVLERLPEGRFGLSAEGHAVLVDENHPAYGAGFFVHLPQTIGIVDQLPQAFKSGVGLP